MSSSTSASSPDPCTPNTTLLVQRARAGDTAAFQALYTCYARALYTFFLGYTGEPPLAEEMVNDTFLRAWQALERYQEEGHFRAWLFRIARNLATDHHRRSKHRPTEIALSEEYLETAASAAAAAPPEETLQAAAALAEVQSALQRLRPDYRAVLLLRFIKRFSVRETAQALDRSEGAVRVLQVRALKALRRVLEQQTEV